MVFKPNKLVIFLSLFVTQVVVNATPAAVPNDKPLDYAKVLGWVSEPGNPYNLAGGYYRSYPIPYLANPMVKSQENSYNIVADHVLYSTKGTSILRGHVRVTQPHRELTSGLAYLYRNKKTGKVETIDFFHNVSLLTPGELLVARYGQANLSKNTIVLHNAAYRNKTPLAKEPIKVVNSKTKKVEYRNYGLNFWGHAKQINQVKKKFYVLHNATYSTCPPTVKQCTWHLHASTVKLNKQKAVGDAWNSVLWFKHIPVFWLPYIDFPLSNKRKSGFLMPVYGTSNNSGFKVGIPYYWNMAPNYDSTWTGTYLSKRGFMLTPAFRYLTKKSQGNITFNVLPNDRAFKSFKKSAQTNPEYASQPTGLRNLANDSDTRWAFRLNNSSTFNDHWSAKVDYNLVSDPYVIENLGSGFINNSNNQLLQQGELQYQGLHWNFLGLLQNYQTLHAIDQQTVDNQYARLPELQLGSSYPNVVSGFDFSFVADDTQFYKEKTPDSTQVDPVIGNRLSFRPVIDYPMIEPYGYLTPRVQVQFTSYNLRQNQEYLSSGLPSPTNVPGSTTVAIPIVDVHGGLYFDRNFKLFGSSYLQTLEPELYYLYVPYHNQSTEPVFDTADQAFNYNTLFLDNSFTGIDRIQNANQIAYAVTSRIINEETGSQQGYVSLGEIAYFSNRRVSLCVGQECQSSSYNNSLNRESFSPVALQAGYTLWKGWGLTGGLTWNPYVRQFSYENASLNYNDHKRHIVNIGYSYVKNGGPITGQPSGSAVSLLKQISLSSEWLVGRHVALYGAWNYSWKGNQTDDQANTYLAGIEYDSACWAIRLVASRAFQGVDNENKNQFNNAYFIQFDLRGLGSAGNENPGPLLADKISGFQDNFDQTVLG